MPPRGWLAVSYGDVRFRPVRTPRHYTAPNRLPCCKTGGSPSGSVGNQQGEPMSDLRLRLIALSLLPLLPACGDDDDPAGAGGSFSAVLSGAEEVPPVTT